MAFTAKVSTASAGSPSGGRLVRQHPDRQQHHIDVAGARRPRAISASWLSGRSPRGPARARRGRPSPRTAVGGLHSAADRGRAASTTRSSRPEAASRRTVAAAMSEVPPSTQHGLRGAEGVDHRCSLLARSERKTWSGSSAARSSRHRSTSGYIAASRSGSQPGVLGQVDPAAGVGHQPVEPVERWPRGRGPPAGRGPASTRRWGRTAARRSPAPNRLSTARKAGACARWQRDQHPGDEPGVRGRELVLHEAVPTVEPVPAGHAVERVEEPRQSTGAHRSGPAGPAGSTPR